MKFRNRVNERLEILRKEKIIGQSLDAKVIISGTGELFDLLRRYESDLPEYFIVSQVVFEEAPGEADARAEVCTWERCHRSWRRVPKLVDYGEFHQISERCKAALEAKFQESRV